MTRKINGLRVAAAVVGISALALTACTGPAATPNATGSGATGAASAPITIGTTDKVTLARPRRLVRQRLVHGHEPDLPVPAQLDAGHAPTPKPDIAESAEFTAPTEYTVKLKAGLKWANGHDLDLLRRQVLLRPPARRSPTRTARRRCWATSTASRRRMTPPSSSSSRAATTRPGRRSSPAPPARSSTTRSSRPTRSSTDDDIVAAKAFAGQYTIDELRQELAGLLQGQRRLQGPARRAGQRRRQHQVLRRLEQPEARRAAGQHRRRVPQPLADRHRRPEQGRQGQGHKGPGGESRYIVFNFDTMPFGAKTADADPAKALAVRQAVGRPRRPRRDRRRRSTRAPTCRCTPTCRRASPAPPSRSRTSTATERRPDRSTRPRPRSRPPASPPRSTLNLQYNPDHYGPSSGDEYALVKAQLEAGGLFTVDLQSTEWVTYRSRPHRPTLPGVPARLVPGLLGRRQLPDAVLRQGQLPGQPLRQPGGRHADQRAGASRPTRPSARP